MYIHYMYVYTCFALDVPMPVLCMLHPVQQFLNSVLTVCVCVYLCVGGVSGWVGEWVCGWVWALFTSDPPSSATGLTMVD